MAKDPASLRLLVAVGSRHDRVCSIGAFARAEARALETVFRGVELLEPDAHDVYPVCASVARPDVIFFHAPALHDRKKPWNALLSAMRLRRAFPNSLFIPVVHEFSEAPLHWKARQVAILKMSHASIVNSLADYNGVKKWQRNVLRTHLGPTLFLNTLNASNLEFERARARESLAREFMLPRERRWILHPGLLTPGKGVNFLAKLGPHLSAHAHLIVMGGQGPKQRDRDFASATLSELTRVMHGRFTFIDSPSDPVFKQALLAANLVVLPYDNGLSERRSSFLSAMSCGADVWTTAGEFTPQLGIEVSGAQVVGVAAWHRAEAAVFDSVARTISEPEPISAERRLKNLAWASGRSWESRARAIRGFIASL